MTEVSLSLGAFWQASLTVGMCSHVSPLDIVLTDDRGSNLTGLTVSNDFQSVSVRAGPLYYEDMSDVHVNIPFNGYSNRYSSVFSISIEVPAVHAYTSGSTRGTTAVALAKELVNASMVCEVEDEYITVVWVEYGNLSTNIVLNLENPYRLLRNGHNLQIHNLNLEQFLTFNYECRVLTAPHSGHSISVANFTTVAISDLIVVSMEQQPRSNGLVAEGFRSNTVLSSSSLLDTEVTLPCYGALDYGRIRWHSTLLHMPGYLSEGSSSPYYSVEYSGSVGTLTLHSYSGGNLRGSLTCYSEEAGLSHPASVTIHIIDGVCSCGHSTGSPYPLSLCPESLHCSCPEGYVGDGVLCSVDSDGDGYTDIDMSDLYYCQSDPQNQLCQQDTCPHLYNPHQSRDRLNDGHPNGVAFVIDGNELPSDVILANASVLASKSLKCLGAQGSTDLSVQVYSVVQSELVTLDAAADICETEANIHQPLDSELTEGAMQCQSATTGATAWIYFTTEACICTRPEEDILPDYILTCQEAGVEACDCSDTECTCGCGYSGDGRSCSLDTDGDGYPNNASPGLCSDRDPQNYCVQDVCPADYDPSNDPGACHTTQDYTAGSMCVAETDSTWMIMWEDTHAGYHDTQLCQSFIPISAAYAFRLCLENGLWSQFIDTSCCKDIEVESIYEELDEILKGEFTNDTKSQLSAALADLVEATTPPDDRSSLYAQDLEITNDILKDTIDFLRNGVHNKLLDEINAEVVQVIDNVLEESNNQGWDQLSNTEEGAEQLLDNVELFGLYLAEAIASPNVDVELDNGKLILNASFNNIYIGAAVQDAFGASDVVFPVAESEFSLEPMFGESLAHIKIPARLLETRANETNTTRVFAVNMVIDNINELLLVNERATEINGTNYTTRAVTNLLVSQVMAGNTRTSTTKLSIPVQLVFVTEEIVNRSRNPRCAYYDFGTSQWLEDGVATESVTMAPDGRSYHVLCSTVHFTSFAVLVDVSDVEMDIPPSEGFALTIVTYVGCVISLLCLGFSIVYYLTYGKALLTSVHYLVHLNLAIALFLGYTVFLAGTYYGPQDQIACALVAGALHYLFLSVFCWMLCEGIMLYLMLVIVFSTLSKKWWLFLLMGWGPPVIVVGVAAGIRYDNYGDPDRGFCWVSVNQGLIWAFVGPMLAVILANMFFLCASLRSLYRVTVGRFGNEQDKKPLIKKLLMAAVILLPILGVTWAFGLLAVNRQTTVFTWLFTIFNSLQGLFFFVFHVIRSDRVWNVMKKFLPGEWKDKRGHSRSMRSSTQSISKSDSFLMDTLKRRQEKKKERKSIVSELSSDAVIVLGNPLATANNPFGTKRDKDLGLASTVLMY